MSPVDDVNKMNGETSPHASLAPAEERADGRLLYAYFDLDIAPPGFNIANFLVLADIEREKRDLAGIHVIIVAGSHDGYRKEDVEYPRYNKDWRVRNLVVPACALLASCESISVFGTRDEAEAFESNCPGPAFPEGYTVAIPTTNHQYAAINAAAAGQRVTRLQPSDQARLYVKQWTEDHAGGRKVVTITLRGSSYDLNRNSDLDTWSEFARTLDAEIYFPVVIRDTERIADKLPPQLEGLTVLPEPAINLELRAALYEAAYLNSGINQRPWTLWHFIEDVRYLTIYIIDRMNEGWDYFHIDGSGFTKGEDMRWAGPLQRTYWGNDSLAEIIREFNEMVARIEGQPTVGAESGGEPIAPPATPQRPRPEARDPVDLAIRYAQQSQYKSAMDTLVHVLRSDPKNARAHEIIGVLWHEMGQYREATKHLIEAMPLDGANVNRIFNLAGALDKLGRRDEALYGLGLAVEEDPDNAKTRERIADILLAVGRHDEAIEHYRYLTGIADRQKSATVKLADALMEAGRADEAAGLYSSMLRGDLNNATLFLRLGDALAKSDRGDKAMLCFRTSNAVHLRKPLPDRSVLEILDRLAPA